MFRTHRAATALAAFAASALVIGLFAPTSVRAGSNSTSDASGDAVLYNSGYTPDGTNLTGYGDLTSLGVSYTTAVRGVKLTANAPALKSPAANWQVGVSGTSLSWYLDTNGDSVDDFFIYYNVNQSTFALQARVFEAIQGSGSLTERCGAIPRYDGPPYSTTDTGYSAEFASLCIDNPTSIRARVVFNYGYGAEAGPTRTYYPYSLDSVPNSGWSASVSKVAASAPPVATKPKLTAKTKPVIHGKHKVGKKLTITKPKWSAKPTKVTYRWYRSGKAISKATKSTYKVRKADRGKKIKVKVTASRSGYTSASTTSKAIKIRKP